MQRKSQRMSRLGNGIFRSLCVFSVIIGLTLLCLLITSLIKNGYHSLGLELFRYTTNPPGQPGGLKNAMIGSCMIVGLGILISIPIGVFAAAYLAFYGKRNKLAYMIRNANDILMTTPSIIIGLFVCAFIVVPMHHYSALAGAIALALISTPMICRTTEDIFYLISPSLRESALALGLKDWVVICRIVFASAKTGVFTGVILALSRIAGETAPLLFTSLSSNFTNFNLLHPTASLPVVIYQYAMSPYQQWQNLAWSGALIMTVAVLIINIMARTIRKKQKI